MNDVDVRRSWPFPSVANVLIIDDDPDVLVTLRDLIEANLRGAHVTTSASGEEALKRTTPPDLVVCDYAIPGRDGVSTLAEVRRRWPKAGRILMTERMDADVAAGAVNDARIERLVIKPFNPNEFLETLRSAWNDRQPRGGLPGRIPPKP